MVPVPARARPALALGEGDLRPRSALEVADVSVSAVRRWFPDLVGASLVFVAPAVAIGWAVAAVSTAAGAVVGVIVAAVALALAHAACVDIVGAGWLGGTPSWRSSVERTVRRAPSILGLWLLGGAGVAAGTLLLVAPGIVVGLGMVPAVPVLVLERTSPGRAISRSQTLSVDRRGSHLVTLVVLLLLVVVVVAIAVQPVLGAAAVTGRREAPIVIAAAVGQVVSAVLVVPLLAAATTAAFLDARVRKEGLDLLYLLDLVQEPPAVPTEVDA